MNLINGPYHDCERKKHHFSCSKSTYKLLILLALSNRFLLSLSLSIFFIFVAHMFLFSSILVGFCFLFLENSFDIISHALSFFIFFIIYFNEVPIYTQFKKKV